MLRTSSSKGGKYEGEENDKRKNGEFSLFSSIDTKFVAGIPDVVAHEEAELAALSKMLKSNSLESSKGENILKRIIPKYKPNSKVKMTNGALILKDKMKINHSQILRPCLSDSDHPGGQSSPSCMKITTLTSNATKSTSKIKSGKGRTRKVRFDKKVTIQYVPADEERGSFEWRKNLTRQGIYEAMLWKAELEKLELEDTLIHMHHY